MTPPDKDLGSTSAYLFGTCHGLPMSAFPEKTQKFLYSHEVCIVESTDMLDIRDPLFRYAEDQTQEIASTQALVNDFLRGCLQTELEKKR